jgi:hypothetical protein
MIERVISGTCIIVMIVAGIHYRRVRPAAIRGNRSAQRQVWLALGIVVASAIGLVVLDSVR